jgi:hypothetical protein
MNLYHVQYDHQSYWVEAESFAVAIEAWKYHVAELWGDTYEEIKAIEPDSVHLVHEEAVIRERLIKAKP